MTLRLAVLTTGRQDYGILRSTILAATASPAVEPLLLVGGMHLSAAFGNTVESVRADGVPIARELDFLGEPPDPCSDAARALGMVGSALDEIRPDALLLVGDRHEVLAAGMAAALQRVPIVHLHGGEETEGAIDNALRHALTKLSHLHLVSSELHARRVRQMGEPAEAVHVVGAPGTDNLLRPDLPAREEIEERLGMSLEEPVVLVTVHPTTLASGDPLDDVRAVAAAMRSVPATYVVTLPNADAGGRVIREFWEAEENLPGRCAVVDALGERYYWGLLRLAAAVLGNSSSGLIEAPAAGVPTVDVGDRQRGRECPAGVARVPAGVGPVSVALRDALRGGAAPQREARTGSVAERILGHLSAWRPPAPPRKSFELLP